MSSKKTISDLPGWGGDPAMRMHVHKPGVSQALTLSEFAGLVTTGEGLQTGDIVLRPDGVYADALECNGSLHATASYPMLAGKLNYGEFGSSPISVNANSEIRSNTAEAFCIRKIGQVRVISETGNIRIYVSGVLQTSIAYYQANTKNIFKTVNGFYFKDKKSTGTLESVYFVDLYGVCSVAFFGGSTAFTEIVGAGTLSAKTDLIFYRKVNIVYVDSKNTATTALSTNIGSISSTDGYAYQTRNGNIYYLGAIDNIYGIYRLTVTANSVAYSLLQAGTFTNAISGKSNYIYFGEGSVKYRLNASSDVISEIAVPGGYYSTGVCCDDNFIALTGHNLTRPKLSFDGGNSWEDCPQMNNYNFIDYDAIVGELVICGKTGSTGSVNGQTGSIQVNAMNFPSGTIFRVPKISSATNRMKWYITI
jgi:hypothetical protein